jgi:hypothetical protein
MKALILSFAALMWVASIHAETTPIDNDVIGLADLIADTATRDLVKEKMLPIPQEIEGLVRRVGIKMSPTLRLRDAKEAQVEIQNFFGWLNRVLELSSLVEAPQQRLAAEKLLAILNGLHTETEISTTAALYQLIGLHQRQLTYALLLPQYAWTWDPVSVHLPDGRSEERYVSDQLILIDLPAIADIICDRLNAYDYDKEFGPLTKAQRAENEPYVRYLCAALGIKYSVPFGGWTPKNLKCYAIKQLRRAAKRPNLAPADAAAIATALHQLEAFQPDAMNVFRL